MNTLYFSRGKKIVKSHDLSLLTQPMGEDALLWVDLIDPSQEDVELVQRTFGFKYQSQQKIEEIEVSSTYFELGSTIYINSDFQIDQTQFSESETVAFIIRQNVLFSKRQRSLKTFDEVIKRMELNPATYKNGFHVFSTVLETRVDLDADMLEHSAKEISNLTRLLSVENNLNEEVLLRIARFQELTMALRETIIEKQRITSAMLKSKSFPDETYEKLRIMIKDINSLLDYTTFNFERLEYLQNTFLGLINIEQNKIIKIFTVVSVVFMPPTLIASMYGMNFQFMPELQWAYGYPLAICMMVCSSVLTLFVFKKKRWL